MTDREFFLETISDELPRFLRVFQALPQDKLDYKHETDPKGKSALELVIAMAVEAATFSVFLSTGLIDFSSVYKDAPQTLANAIKVFEDGCNNGKAEASGMSEETWEASAKMMSGEKMAWETTRGRMAWSLLFDAIHHRGQLSTMIRPMGGKVPSIYGPSADSNE